MIRDSAYDPRSGATQVYNISNEEHRVRRMTDLADAFGFFINHMPIPFDQNGNPEADPIVRIVTMIDGEPSYSEPLTRVDIAVSPSTSEYSLYTGTVDAQGRQSGERLGQLFVNINNNGLDFVVTYRARGSIVHSANLAPLYYMRPPFTPHPSELWLNSLWQIEKNDSRFIRFSGGNASDFESGVQPDSAPNITGSIKTDRGVFVNPAVGAFTILPDNPQGVWMGTDNSSMFNKTATFDASRSSPTYGRRAEVAPLNETWQYYRKID